MGETLKYQNINRWNKPKKQKPITIDQIKKCLDDSPLHADHKIVVMNSVRDFLKKSIKEIEDRELSAR